MNPDPTESFNIWLISSETRAQFCKSLAIDSLTFARVTGADGHAETVAIVLLSLLLRTYVVAGGILALDTPWPGHSEQDIDWQHVAAAFIHGLDDAA